MYNNYAQIRMDKEMKMFLLSQDDQSKYVRDLINKDRIKAGDPTFIDTKIKDLKKEIEKLLDLKKDSKKLSQSNEKSIHEFLEYHSTNYKQNATHRTEDQRLKFIEKAILPTLEKHGSTQTAKQIDDVLINWPE